jgi:hypothetical protein
MELRKKADSNSYTFASQYFVDAFIKTAEQLESDPEKIAAMLQELEFEKIAESNKKFEEA